MNAPDGSDAQRPILHTLIRLYPARLPSLVVELLEVQGTHFIRHLFSDSGFTNFSRLSSQ